MVDVKSINLISTFFQNIVEIKALTLNELISLIINFTGLAVIIFTLYQLLSQNKEMCQQTAHLAETLRTNVYSSGTSLLFAIDQVFISYPELWPYFNAGKDIDKHDPNYYRVLAISGLLLDSFDSVLVLRFADGWPRDKWRAYIMDTFNLSPILGKLLDETEAWYGSELKALKDRAQRLSADNEVLTS